MEELRNDIYKSMRHVQRETGCESFPEEDFVDNLRNQVVDVITAELKKMIEQEILSGRMARVTDDLGRTCLRACNPVEIARHKLDTD